MNNTKKNILFNCSTNIVGGGMKNSAFFIKNAILDDSFNWTFAISMQVKLLLEKWAIKTDEMFVFEESPARSLIQRNRLLEIVKENQINLVYTMAGPAYVKFNVTHVMGMSNPYFTHADFQGFKIGRNWKQLFKIVSVTIYGLFHVKKANFFIFQTNQAKNGFSKRFKIKENRLKVISNAVGNDFGESFRNEKSRAINSKEEILFFCPAAPYSHKAIHLLPKIAKKLFEKVNNQFRFVFIITIDKNSIYYSKVQKEIKKNNVENLFENIGKFGYEQSVELHKKSDVILVPSILETFSSSYLEAMIANKPLIVSNKAFAKDICKDAALYINPLNFVDSAEKISDLIVNVELQKMLVSNGKEVLKDYGNQDSRFEKIMNYLQTIN
jgi:glycosyltransferase involved in cell wall biosynthesis